MNKPPVDRKQRAEQDSKSDAEKKMDGQLDEGQLDEVAGGMHPFWRIVGKAYAALGGGDGGDGGSGSGGGVRG